MIKKLGLLALAASLLVAALSPVLAHAQAGLTVLDSSASVQFPLKLDFSLSARSDADIADIRLRYVVERESFAPVTSEVDIEFAPASEVDVGWTWDMRKSGGLPPGTAVDYWWVVRDTLGRQLETAPAVVRFDDIRYLWRSLAEGKVTLYWYQGEESFAHELMAASQRALERLAEDTGAELERPAKLYIYASTQDLQGAMVYPQEWTGGAAFTRYSTIAIGIALTDLEWGKRTIAHELAHLVVYQMTSNPYGGLPTWLEEGLAMYAEGSLESGYIAYLNRAIAGDSLISVRSLSSPFSAYAEQSLLSYAQSYRLVEYLIGQYGRTKMLELLGAFRQGSGYDGALEAVYGFDMDGLDELWRRNIAPAQASQEQPGISPVLLGVLIALGAGFLVGLGVAIRYKVGSKG